jgi:hypothetical protein
MIISRATYINSPGKIYPFHLDENIEEMTYKYEQQHLGGYHQKRHHRHKHKTHHRNKLNNNIYEKYVSKNIFSWI